MTGITEWYLEELEEEPYSDLFGNPHTMAPASLDRYVIETKFSVEQTLLLNSAIKNDWQIKVIGVYVNHIDALLCKLRVSEVSRATRVPSRTKRFNNNRPIFLNVRSDSNEIDELWICVFPSREYVQQVTALAYYYLCKRANELGQPAARIAGRVKAIHFPKLEAGLPEWSGLRRAVGSVVHSGDVCVLGHAEEVSNYLSALDIPMVSTSPIGGGDYGELIVHELPGYRTRVTLVGIKHSFWGSASGVIAATLAEAGASEIVYVAKAGTLIEAASIHKLISPQIYYTLEKPSGAGDSFWTWKQQNVRSSLHELAPELVNQIRTGVHLTVPTVVGETIQQHNRYKALRPATIDNEIGYIARSISSVNKRKVASAQTGFTCLHFLTDYLKAEQTKGHPRSGVEEDFDLSTLEREKKLKIAQARDHAFERATEIIVSFLKQLGAERTRATNFKPALGPRAITERRECIEECHRSLQATRVFRTIVAGPFFLHPDWYFDRKIGRNSYPDFDRLLADRVTGGRGKSFDTRLIITNSERYPEKIMDYLEPHELDRFVEDCLAQIDQVFAASSETGLRTCCASVGHTHIPYIFDASAICQYRVHPLTPTVGGYLYTDPVLVEMEREKFDNIFASQVSEQAIELSKLRSIFIDLPARVDAALERRNG